MIRRVATGIEERANRPPDPRDGVARGRPFDEIEGLADRSISGFGLRVFDVHNASSRVFRFA
jgi:hypothetical protein